MHQKFSKIDMENWLSKGMIFVRIDYILRTMLKAPLVAVIFISLAFSSIGQYATASSKNLQFSVYADGTTHVFYQTDVNPQTPDITLNLFGNNIDNFVIQDENGTILASNATQNSATVETLGASSIKVDYDTPDLISKNGKTWTFHIDSPMEYSILLPKNTVIVGMTQYPLNLQIVDDQSLISLPSGSSEINYVFGSLGTSQAATLAIQKAQDFIDTINSAGIKTPQALTKLDQAKQNFSQGQYSDAESLANDAKNMALQEREMSQSGQYSLNPSLVLIPVIAASGAAIAIIKFKKSRKVITDSEIQKSNPSLTIDSDTIHKLKPDLRQDDKNIIDFILEKGGQVYESELRKKFLLPRTTMWRAVKRLEREEIVEIEKIDQQNLIKLRKKWGDFQ